MSVSKDYVDDTAEVYLGEWEGAQVAVKKLKVISDDYLRESKVMV